MTPWIASITSSTLLLIVLWLWNRRAKKLGELGAQNEGLKQAVDSLVKEGLSREKIKGKYEKVKRDIPNSWSAVRRLRKQKGRIQVD